MFLPLINHIKNISQGGEISKDFEEFQRVFSIYEITIYGNVSDELKKAIAPFKIKTRYVPVTVPDNFLLSRKPCTIGGFF